VDGEPSRQARAETIVVFALAAVAALGVKVPELFGLDLSGADTNVYMRNFSLFVLPAPHRLLRLEAPAGRAHLGVAGAGLRRRVLFANVFPFEPGGDTGALTALHLPIALWLVVGIAYAGGRWRDSARRMDFVRFSGELFIYYVLIALGGGVLIAFTMGMFQAIGISMPSGWSSRGCCRAECSAR
jgi:hypothetical protein